LEARNSATLKDPEWAGYMLGKTLLGRLGRPEEVAVARASGSFRSRQAIARAESVRLCATMCCSTEDKLDTGHRDWHGRRSDRRNGYLLFAPRNFFRPRHLAPLILDTPSIVITMVDRRGLWGLIRRFLLPDDLFQTGHRVDKILLRRTEVDAEKGLMNELSLNRLAND
jgi:hypothetical protein